jgi:aminoglycoside phosphotransferase (APT) family kinase protein
MADVGLLMVYWTGPKDAAGGLASTATAVEGFPDRSDLLERYAKVSGRDVGDVDYYTAFAYWKLACIVEGVYARYVAGAMGSNREGYEMFKLQVERSAAMAAEIVGRGS